MVFIDESGDPGFKKGCSSSFVVAAVVVDAQEELEVITDAIEQFKQSIGWRLGEELKFHKTHKDTIRLAIKTIRNYKYYAYAISFDKTKVDLRHLSSIEKNSIFLFAIKELLIRINIQYANVIIDGVRGPKYVKKARTYLRNELKKSDVKIGRIAFENSVSNPLIQLADLVAGAVSHEFTKKKDARDYTKLFGNKLKAIYNFL